MDQYYPTRAMRPAPQVFSFPAGDDLTLPETYVFNNKEHRTDNFLAGTDTAALLVLVDGKIRYENYFLTGGPDVPWTSWSVAKSFVSAMTGIALEEKLIGSPDDPVGKYLPLLKGSAYETVSIRSVLQMSSGAAWNEDYSDPESDVNRLGAVMTGEGSLQNLVQGIKPEVAPDTVCRYNSAETQVLGMLIAAVTGQTLSDTMQTKLCDPLGFEYPGFWLLDGEGVELALGGLNLTARDYAKIGELYRNKGRWQDRQIVPESWVSKSVRSDKAHLQAGRVIVGGHVFPSGYAYQWWVPSGDEGEFSAIGIYNQFVYVNPARHSVIVKLSANRAYGTSTEESTNREEETIAWLRAVNNCLRTS
ncbi:MAG: serine hydrolase [Parvularculales bacterium]